MSQATLPRAGPVEEVVDDAANGLIGRQLGQRHHRSEHLPDVGHREPGKTIDLDLDRESRIDGSGLSPVELGLSHEPGRHDGQSEVVFPGGILDGPQLVPAGFTLGIADRALDERPRALPSGQGLQGRLRRGVGEGVGPLAVGALADHQPLLGR